LQTGAAQTPQKCRTDPSGVTKRAGSPDAAAHSNAARAKIATVVNAAPCTCLQKRQWQLKTKPGSPATA
jgi:hypothetical protein